MSVRDPLLHNDPMIPDCLSRHDFARHVRAAASRGPALAAVLLAACVGGSGGGTTTTVKPPVLNTTTVSVDSGPAAASGAINHAYVTVKVCVPGSQSQCANIDHVLLDTGSTGLRLVRSVLTAGGVTLAPSTDGAGQVIEECENFAAGATWGPVAQADVYIAGESASKVPVQIMDDTNSGAPPPATCGPNGTLLNGVSGFYANGVLGVGVFAQDCGPNCVAAAPPLPVYYGCTTAGACTAENAPLTVQVANVVAQFAADNNGVIVSMPSLVNANGDATATGELIFGIGTQSDNAPPASGLTVLGTNANGMFTATYNGGTTALPALIDSGTNSYFFNDAAIAICSGGSFNGDYCPVSYPQSAYAIVTGVGANGGSATVNFAIANPNASFTPNAAAYADLAAGIGTTKFILGMPFFYGRKVYVAIEQKTAGAYTGPYFAF